MSENIVITADSTCDLSPELINKHNIIILPLYITMDEKSLKDGVEIYPQDIYEYFDKTGQVPKTAACSVEDYLNLFKPLAESGKTVIHLNISHGFSSCYQNAVIAAQEFKNVYVIDSQNLSTGIGLLVLKAAELAEKQTDAEQIVDILNETIPKVEASFVIDTLTYLHKGGRCSTVAKLGANLLKLKPCIEVSDGLMHVGKKYRGSLDKCINQYVEDRLNGRTDIDKSRIFITHTQYDPKLVEAVAKAVKAHGFSEILETTAGCTITNHCGPNTLGILFIKK